MQLINNNYFLQIPGPVTTLPTIRQHHLKYEIIFRDVLNCMAGPVKTLPDTEKQFLKYEKSLTIPVTTLSNNRKHHLKYESTSSDHPPKWIP
jgi:hypothetical protein